MAADRPNARPYAIAVALLAWAALMLQLVLTLDLVRANGQGVGWGLVVYFGYFTILSNLLAALAATMSLVARDSPVGRFFARDSTVTGVTAAIATVGLAYFGLLRHVWDPQGWQFIADVALHYVVPALFFGYWLLAVRPDRVHWADVPSWTLFPIAYLVYALARGALIGSYPYYFIDIGAIGYGQALVNALGILALFLAVAAALVITARLRLRIARH